MTTWGAGPSKCALLVDDDDDVVEAVAEALEDEGYAVLVAFSGDQAWMTIEKHAPRPDAIVLGHALAAGDGVGFLRRVRADPRWADIPVLIVSPGDPSPSSAIEARDASERLNLDALLAAMRVAVGSAPRCGWSEHA